MTIDSNSLQQWSHDHAFGTNAKTSGEKRTRWVIGITALMMVAEIAAGLLYGSMALLADGWHMGTHAAALSVAAFAYFYARRHCDDPSFSFGTGKVGALGGFASAVSLAVIALLVFGESALRLAHPVTIRFDEAIAVAGLGLLVNLFSAYLLRDSHDGHGHAHGGHGHGHTHGGHDHGGHGDAHVGLEHGHGGHGSEHHDHNLRAAYLHVLADALTSVLAILALFAGKYLNWMWMDPVMGLVGSVVIARWSLGLLKDTSRVLLDAELSPERRQTLLSLLESSDDTRVTDLHVWRVGPKHLASIVAVVSTSPREPDFYKELLRSQTDLVHVTVEVQKI